MVQQAKMKTSILSSLFAFVFTVNALPAPSPIKTITTTITIAATSTQLSSEVPVTKAFEDWNLSHASAARAEASPLSQFKAQSSELNAYLTSLATVWAEASLVSQLKAQGSELNAYRTSLASADASQSALGASKILESKSPYNFESITSGIKIRHLPSGFFTIPDWPKPTANPTSDAFHDLVNSIVSDGLGKFRNTTSSQTISISTSPTAPLDTLESDTNILSVPGRTWWPEPSAATAPLDVKTTSILNWWPNPNPTETVRTKWEWLNTHNLSPPSEPTETEIYQDLDVTASPLPTASMLVARGVSTELLMPPPVIASLATEAPTPVSESLPWKHRTQIVNTTITSTSTVTDPTTVTITDIESLSPTSDNNIWNDWTAFSKPSQWSSALSAKIAAATASPSYNTITTTVTRPARFPHHKINDCPPGKLDCDHGPLAPWFTRFLHPITTSAPPSPSTTTTTTSTTTITLFPSPPTTTTSPSPSPSTTTTSTITITLSPTPSPSPSTTTTTTTIPLTIPSDNPPCTTTITHISWLDNSPATEYQNLATKTKYIPCHGCKLEIATVAVAGVGDGARTLGRKTVTAAPEVTGNVTVPVCVEINID